MLKKEPYKNNSAKNFLEKHELPQKIYSYEIDKLTFYYLSICSKAVKNFYIILENIFVVIGIISKL